MQFAAGLYDVGLGGNVLAELDDGRRRRQQLRRAAQEHLSRDVEERRTPAGQGVDVERQQRVVQDARAGDVVIGAALGVGGAAPVQ